MGLRVAQGLCSTYPTEAVVAGSKWDAGGRNGRGVRTL